MADKKLNIKVRAEGAKKAKQDLKGVESGIAKMGKAAAKAGAVYFAAKGLISGMSKIIELAGEQELAERKLSIALGRRSQGLLDQASALQQVSTFGDEAIISQQAFLASLEFSEEQIKKIIEASINLSAATGISLESAVRNTAKTFSGLSGELGELIPQLRGLTAEQMKAGDAVKLMSDLFEGQAEGQTQTMSGSIQQMKNAWGDAAEALGNLFAPAIIKVTGLLKDAANAATTVLERLKGFFGDKDEVSIEEQILATKAKGLQIRVQEFKLMELQTVPVVKIAEQSQKAAEWTAQTATNLLTSAVMGDNVSESLKRAVIQLGLMVAQAKIYKAIMASSTFATGGFFGSAVKFLFGASPTQAAPSPNVTINQNFGGMGVIDQNFAANSIIPAINKAVSTGQARITK